MEVGGYLVEAGTLLLISSYTMGRDQAIFPSPGEVLPGRWGRTDTSARAERALASLPFGHGVRGCIGRRVAEAQLVGLVAAVCSRWRLQVEGEVGYTTRMVGVSDRNIQLVLRPRE